MGSTPWHESLESVSVSCEEGSSLRARDVAWLEATVTAQDLAQGSDSVTQETGDPPAAQP